MRVKPQLPKRINWNHICIIGEAPGKTEAELGKPFVGRAGKMLNETLRQAGIRRKHCLIINPFNQRPPGNSIKYFFEGPPYHSNVKRKFRRQIELLHNTLLKYNPAMILLLGRTAGWVLTNYTGTLAARFGKVVIGDHGPMMYLYHPAYLLRDPTNITQQIKYLKLARIIAKQLL
jgi:uracil-DNA glycosylase family 4